MLVKELIQELQKFNPEQEMVFGCNIESGRSLSISKTGDWDLDIEDLEDDEVRQQLIEEMGYGDEEDLDEDEVKELDELVKDYQPRVVFNISGEETDYQ